MEYNILEDNGTNATAHKALLLKLDLKCDKKKQETEKNFKEVCDRCDVNEYANILNQYLYPKIHCVNPEIEIKHLHILSLKCERGFSAVKRIKSDWRSCLSTKMLNHLLTVVVEGPSLVDYRADQAIERWRNGHRQPQFSQEQEDQLLTFMAILELRS